MKEIGGYFGLEQLISNEYYKDLIALNTARNALLYVLKARKIRKLYIPDLLCDSVSNMCNREGYAYSYYRISTNFIPDFDAYLEADEYIYIVNYFGQISNEKLVQLAAKYKNVIFDNVQAFFQEPVKGIDTIYSCRKFFGVPDGAYLSTDCILEDELKTDMSRNRMKHLLGRFESDSASRFYKDFKENDDLFDSLELKKMSKITHSILGAIDYERIKKIRENNFSFLHEQLSVNNKLQITIPTGPYAYPYYCKDGMIVKKRLAEQKIYVPTLWPNVLASRDKMAGDYSSNILPLPCDQRYCVQDLKYMIEVIKYAGCVI